MDHLHHFVRQHGLLTAGSCKKAMQKAASSSLRSPKLVSGRHGPFSSTHGPNSAGEVKNATIQSSLTPERPMELGLFRIDLGRLGLIDGGCVEQR